MLVAFAGTSGCGKNTIINQILNNNPEYKLMPSITTRKMREGESQGNPYIFVSEQEFKKKIADGEMLEYEEVHKGNFYGISKKILNEYESKYNVLLKDVDVNGIINAKKKGVDMISIFIEVTDKENLYNRIIARGETHERAMIRISRFDYEKSHKKDMDYVVTNNYMNDLPVAISKIEDIIKKERQKRNI